MHMCWMKAFSSSSHKEVGFPKSGTFKRYVLKCWWTPIYAYVKFLYYNRYSSKANSLVNLYKQIVCESFFVWSLVPKGMSIPILGQNCGLSNWGFSLWKWYQEICCKTQLSFPTLGYKCTTVFYNTWLFFNNLPWVHHTWNHVLESLNVSILHQSSFPCYLLYK